VSVASPRELNTATVAVVVDAIPRILVDAAVTVVVGLKRGIARSAGHAFEKRLAGRLHAAHAAVHRRGALIGQRTSGVFGIDDKTAVFEQQAFAAHAEAGPFAVALHCELHASGRETKSRIARFGGHCMHGKRRHGCKQCGCVDAELRHGRYIER
jgi:hypothetical protein